MARTVTHLSLHRITGIRPAPSEAHAGEPEGGIELRVVADVEDGVLPVVQMEETVIRGYAQQQHWPHRWVTLFILRDLQPLVRQLEAGIGPLEQAPRAAGGERGQIDPLQGNLPPGGMAVLQQRPVVNVYDLDDPDNCHVFVNRQAMIEAAYWDDPLAIQGLLAHEHAHPLVEDEMTRASRRLQVQLSLVSDAPTSGGAMPERQAKAARLFALLADKLCVYAPREILANELAIASGFGEALFHLDRRNVDNAGRSVAGREGLARQLQQEVTQQSLTPAAAHLLLLIGDMTSFLDLALEVAPFYRAGWADEAQQLEAVLEAEVFPHLEPSVAQAYAALRQHYIALSTNLSLPGLIDWGEEILRVLAQAIAGSGFTVQLRLVSTDRPHTGQREV